MSNQSWTDKIWHKLLENCQETTLTIGDAYRMKSGLFEDIDHLLKERDERVIEELETSPKMLDSYWYTRGDDIPLADVYREAIIDLKTKLGKGE